MSDTDVLLIDDDTMLKNIETYKNTYQLLEESAKSLLNLASTLEGNWKGKSYENFKTAASNGISSFKETGNLIKDLAQELCNYLEEMKEKDNENANLWTKIWDCITGKSSTEKEIERTSEELLNNDWDIAEEDTDQLLTDKDIILDRAEYYERQERIQKMIDENGGVDPRPQKAYIYYQKDALAGTDGHTFEDEANLTAKKWKEANPDLEVELVPVENMRELEKEWNNMDDETYHVTNTELIFHGSLDGRNGDTNPESAAYCCDTSVTSSPTDQAHTRENAGTSSLLATSDNNRSHGSTSDNVVVGNLKRKKMDVMTFSTCNSANLDAGENNLVNSFANGEGPADVDYIVGCDGTTFYNYDNNKLQACPGNGGATLQAWSSGRNGEGIKVYNKQEDGTLKYDDTKTEDFKKNGMVSD